MKVITINDKIETCSDDVYPRLGLKQCKHEKHILWINPSGEELYPDGCGQAKIVVVDDPYYKEARKFPNRHLIYLNPFDEESQSKE